MKATLLTAALLAAFSCQAADLEIGLGASQFTPSGNGIWYQKGFPYKHHMTSPSFKLGVTGHPFDGWRWHAGMEYLGRYGVESTFVAADSNYDLVHETCFEPCMPLSDGKGSGRSYGVYLTTGPEWHWRGFTVHPQVGLWAYRPQWHWQTGQWRPCPTACDPVPIGPQEAKKRINGSYLVGVSLVRGQWSLDTTLRLTVVPKADDPGNHYPAVTNGKTLNLSITRRF